MPVIAHPGISTSWNCGSRSAASWAWLGRILIAGPLKAIIQSTGWPS